MAYWYRIDSYYIALYGTVGILAGLLTMVVDVGANIGEKRQQLLVALEDYMDNSLFFRPGKGRMAAAESEDAVRRPTVVARNQETGPVPVYEAEGYGNELGILMNPQSSYYVYDPAVTFLILDLAELVEHRLNIEEANVLVRNWFSSFSFYNFQNYSFIITNNRS